MFGSVNNNPPYHYEIKEQNIRKSENHFIKNEEIRTQLYELYSKTDQSNSYQLTIPLLISAQLGQVELYKEIVSKIYSNLDLSNEMNLQEFQSIAAAWGTQASFNIWLMGRILVAADNIQDKPIADQVSALMTNALEAQTNIDPFSTWAWGYLAMHYSSDTQKYPYYRDTMITSTDALKKQVGEKEKDNVQWAMVMDILAAASAGDYETYSRLLQECKEWTGKESLSAAILTIPKEDFTAWALALVRLASAKIKDVSAYQELALPLEQALKDSPSEGDRLLAQVNNLLSELMM